VPRSAESVELFASAPPAAPHVDVALLEVERVQSLKRRGRDYMIERLREKAGKLGCDAVFIKGTSEHVGAEPGNLSFLDPDTKQLHATCIVYSGAAPPPSTAQRGAHIPSVPYPGRETQPEALPPLL
jgi:hypothetical protein